jgi:hypothetical protein
MVVIEPLKAKAELFDGENFFRKWTINVSLDFKGRCQQLVSYDWNV